MKKLLKCTAVACVALLLAVSCASAPAKTASAQPAASAPKAVSSEAKLYRMTGDQNYRSPHCVTIDAASVVNQSTGLASDWYKDSAFYHVWVKAFSDYDGDGCGDFRGITAKLDYIKNDLGCDAIWLSPIFDCAGKGTAETQNMHGYDTTDFYAVNDYFGNEEHLEQLLVEAHKRGMKVIFDFVPNHTSSSHPWFLNSAKMQDGKTDWYLWNDEKLPWNPMGNANTWSFNLDRQSFYYGAFWSGMPDLNYRNREVREEMKNVARYWLNKGFDGIRIDAVRYLVENPGYNGQRDQEETHQFFEELRAEVVDKYAALGSPKFMVGEAWIGGNRGLLERYFGSDEKPEFQMLFEFDFSGQVNAAAKYRNPGVFANTVKYWADRNSPSSDDRIAYFLCNHDNVSSRPASIYTETQLRLATAMELLQPGTPFVYYANEIGQKNAAGYTGEDIRLRYPLDWNAADAQTKQGDSVLNLHKALLAVRRQYPAIRRGSVSLQSASVPTVQAVALSYEGKTVLCVYNLAAVDSGAVTVTLDADVKGNVVGTLIGSSTVKAAGKTLEISGFGPNGFGVYILGEKAVKNYFAY